jgi:hypothetical protein
MLDSADVARAETGPEFGEQCDRGFQGGVGLGCGGGNGERRDQIAVVGGDGR